MSRKGYIVNPDEYVRFYIGGDEDSLLLQQYSLGYFGPSFFLWQDREDIIGGLGDVLDHFPAWAVSHEEAVNTTAEWSEHNPETEPEEFWNDLDEGFTYTESGYFPSEEWGITTITDELIYDQIARASLIIQGNPGFEVEYAVDKSDYPEEWRTERFFPSPLIPYVVGAVRRECDVLPPGVTPFPHFSGSYLVGRNELEAEMHTSTYGPEGSGGVGRITSWRSLEFWIVNLSCETPEEKLWNVLQRAADHHNAHLVPDADPRHRASVHAVVMDDTWIDEFCARLEVPEEDSEQWQWDFPPYRDEICYPVAQAWLFTFGDWYHRLGILFRIAAAEDQE